MFLFCLTDEVALCYYAKRIKRNARIGERDERSGLFPLLYAVCGCSANMALTGKYGFNGLDRPAADRPQRRHFAEQKTVPEQAAPVRRCITILLQRQCGCVAEACDDGVQRITVCLRCDPALRVARRRLSLFITGGRCDRLRWSKLFPPLLLLHSLTQTKAVISIPFFGHIITISVHRKVMLSMDFLFCSEPLPRPFRRGRR